MLKYNCGNLLAKVVDSQFTDVAQVEFELTESQREKEENSDGEELSPTTKPKGEKAIQINCKLIVSVNMKNDS